MRGWRLLKILTVVVAVLCLLLAVGTLYLALGGLGHHRELVERLASDAIGRRLEIAGAFEARIGLTTRVVATDVTLGAPEWSHEPHLATVERLEAELDLRSLVSGPITLRRAWIDGARVVFETSAEHGFSWVFETSGEGGGAPVELLIEHALLEEVELVYRPPAEATPLELTVHRLEFATDQRQILDLDLVGTVAGEPLHIAGLIGSLSALINTAAVEHDLELELGATRLATAGTIADLGTLTGVDARVTARGPRLEDVFAVFGADPPVGGPFRLAAVIGPSSTGSAVDLDAAAGEITAQVAGEIDSLTRPGALELEVAVSAPDAAAVAALAGLDHVPHEKLEVSGRLAWAGFPIRFNDLRVRVGDNTAAADGVLGAPPRLLDTDFRFEGEGPDVSAVAALAGLELPAESYRIGGRVVRVAEGLRADGIEARIGRSELRIDGFIGDPPEHEGTALSFHAEGPSLRPYQRLAGLDLPRGAFVLGGRLAEAPGAIRLEEVTGRAGDITAAVDGTIRLEGGFAGSELRLTAAGPDARSLAGLTGLDELPTEPWQVGGTVTLLQRGLRLHSADARLGSLRVEADGTVVTTPGLVGSDLELRLDAPDLAHAGSIAGISSLPNEPLEISGGLRVVEDGYLLDSVRAISQEITVHIDGRLGSPPGLDGSNLELRADGAGLGRWSGLAGVRLPDDRFEVAGRLRIEESGFELEDATLSLGGARAAIDGIVRPSEALVGTDVRIELEGDELRRIGRTIASVTGRAAPELPAFPFTVATGLRVEDDGYRVADLRATLGDAEAEVDGLVGRPPDFIGTDLRLRGDGPSAAPFTALTGVSMPVAPFRFSGGVRRDSAGFGFDRLEVRLGDSRAHAHGTLGAPPTLIGTDLELHASGPDLSIVGELSGTDLLPAKEFSIDGRFQGTPEAFTASDLAVTVGGSDLSGQLSADITGTPDVRASLISRRLDLRDLGSRVSTAEAEIDAPAGEPRSGRVIPDEPLRLEFLELANGRLELSINRMSLPATEFRNLELAAELEDGALHLTRLAGVGDRQGRLEGSLSLEPSDDAYHLRTRVDLQQVRLEVEQTSIPSSQRPPVDVLVELEGRGRSPHEIAASAGGRVQVVIGSGTVDSSIIDVITADFMLQILKLLNPFAKRRDQTEFQCAVLAMEIDDGQVRMRPLAVQTDTTTMLGDGTVDLDSERLELEWVTKPRKGLGLSASMITNPYIKLGGTLAKPALQMKEMEAVAATGIGVATLGISFVAKGLLDRITAENKVCDAALEKIGRGQAKKKRRPE